MRTVMLISVAALFPAIAAGSTYGSGTESDPYLISSYTELTLLQRYPSGHFKLTGDIDASASASEKPGNHDSYAKSTDNVCMGWIPINSSAATPFSGVLDGDGHAIRFLTSNRPGYNDVALFKKISGARIVNLHLDHCKFWGKDQVAGFAATSYNSTIENCTITGSIEGHKNVGAIAGDFSVGSIVNCSFTGTIRGTLYIGGLAGSAKSGTIRNCSMKGSIWGLNALGGLLGSSDSCSMQYCFSQCFIYGAGSIGGLIGSAGYRSTIRERFSVDTINGTRFLGGCAGALFDSAEIADSYAACLIRGTSYTGGLVGECSNGTILTSFVVGPAYDQLNGGGLVGGTGTGTATVVSSYYDSDKADAGETTWGVGKADVQMSTSFTQ